MMRVWLCIGLLMLLFRAAMVEKSRLFLKKSTLQWIVAPQFTFIYTCMQPQSRFLDFFGWLFYHRGPVAVILHAIFRCLAGRTIIRVGFSEKKFCFPTLSAAAIHWTCSVELIHFTQEDSPLPLHDHHDPENCLRLKMNQIIASDGVMICLHVSWSGSNSQKKPARSTAAAHMTITVSTFFSLEFMCWYLALLLTSDSYPSCSTCITVCSYTGGATDWLSTIIKLLFRSAGKTI